MSVPGVSVTASMRPSMGAWSDDTERRAAAGELLRGLGPALAGDRRSVAGSRRTPAGCAGRAVRGPAGHPATPARTHRAVVTASLRRRMVLRGTAPSHGKA